LAARTDFNDGVARIRRFRRDQTELEDFCKALLLVFQSRDLFPRHLAQFRFRWFALKQGAVLVKVGKRFQIVVTRRDQFFEPGVFLAEFLRALRLVKDLGVAE
jgi:hypothetical protein